MQPTDQVLYAAFTTCIMLVVAFSNSVSAYALITIFFLPFVVFMDTISQPDTPGHARSGMRKWIYPIFGLAYSAFLGMQILNLGRQTLAEQTPLEQNDPNDYILFVATFAWAFLLLTYRPPKTQTQKQE